MSESGASSSSSRSPTPAPKKPTKTKGKASKDKSSNSKGKNEGVDPDWEFKPPPGRVVLEDSYDAGEFDWDSVKDDDDVELWLIRIPEGVKPKYLEGLKIDDVVSSKSVKVGALARKYATFDIWSVGSDTAEDTSVGGEEIRHLSCLLPRKKKGKHYAAPKEISRHLVLSAQPVTPTAPPAESIPLKNESTGKYQNPVRESYPGDCLTHSFAPYGSHTTIPAEGSAEMEVDDDEEQIQLKDASPSKKTKGKKRKGAAEEASEDAPAPKKSKKTKSLG